MTQSRAQLLASMWIIVWALPTGIFLIMATTARTGFEDALGALVFAIACGIMSAGGAAYLNRLDSPRLHLPGSLTHEPMRRLDDAEAALENLLDQFEDERLPAGWADRTRYAIANTSHALRAIAARLEAGERALRRSDWRWERETLAERAVELRDRLARGLDAYDQLIAALGQAVASTTPPPLDALTDAIEHLSGLAQALRELRDQDR